MHAMNLNHLLMEYYRHQSPPIRCKDGHVIRVRVGPIRKCIPESFRGPWTHVEVVGGMLLTTVLAGHVPVEEIEDEVVSHGGYDWLKIKPPSVPKIKECIKAKQPQMFDRKRLIEVGHCPDSYRSFRGLSGQTYVFVAMGATKANLIASWVYNPRECVIEPTGVSFSNAAEFRAWARTQG